MAKENLYSFKESLLGGECLTFSHDATVIISTEPWMKLKRAVPSKKGDTKQLYFLLTVLIELEMSREITFTLRS